MEENHRIHKVQQFHGKAFRVLIIVLSFLIPVYGRILPPLIALLVLNWLIEGCFMTKFRMLKENRSSRLILAFAFIYLLYLAGMLYSHNMDYGWFDLEVKLALLVFPLVLSTTPADHWKPGFQENVFRAFIAGCFTITMILLGHAAFFSFFRNAKEAFSYESLSWYFHPSYLAMYLVFAIAVLIHSLITGSQVQRKYLAGMFFLVVWFFQFVIMLSSKAGILILAVIVATGLVYLTMYSGSLKRTLFWLAVAILAFSLSLTMSQVATQRLITAKESINLPAGGENHGSTSERIGIWKAGLHVLRSNWLYGVGTGDVKDALLETYQEQHFDAAFAQKLNAHSQYLQTFISIGIPGIVTLVSMLLFPFINAFRRKDYIRFAFLLIFALNIAVESMLETQAGVVFYAFFNGLLLWNSQKVFPGEIS